MEDHYTGDKVPAYTNLNARRASSLILRLISIKETQDQLTPGPLTTNEPEEEEEEEEDQEIETLLQDSDNNQNLSLTAPKQGKGKKPTISLSITPTQKITPTPPTIPKPLTLTTAAPKVNMPAPLIPQAQAGLSTQEQSTGSTNLQPAKPQTISQPLQQSTPPPPPAPPARQIMATMSAIPAKAKWALPTNSLANQMPLETLEARNLSQASISPLPIIITIMVEQQQED
ncbi:hypothetical protein FRB93_009297 [Tulasnella sp. JGI-2019a]|nr:hypothetical protein FRB93_009297 [Tulasnella sp. JGI-2019a]